VSPASEPEAARERVALIMFTTVSAVAGMLISSVLFIAPVPLAVLIYRHGLRPGIIAAIVSGLLAGFIMQHPAATLLILLVLGLGVAIGEALRDGLSFNQTMLVAWGGAFLAFGALYAVSGLLFGIDLIEATTKTWLEQLVRIMGVQGMQPLSAAELENLAAHLRSLLPGMLALSAGGISLLDYWFTGRWLRRLGSEIPWFPPFAQWDFPWYLAWGYIAGIGLPLLRGIIKSPLLIPVATNFELVFRFIFMVQGLAVIWYYLTRRGGRRAIAFVLTGLSLLFSPAVVLIGLLDAWFDLRRLKRPR
jgi:uncharacterized protein YybS (DUF2232 family)